MTSRKTASKEILLLLTAGYIYTLQWMAPLSSSWTLDFRKIVPDMINSRRTSTRVARAEERTRVSKLTQESYA